MTAVWTTFKFRQTRHTWTAVWLEPSLNLSGRGYLYDFFMDITWTLLNRSGGQNRSSAWKHLLKHHTVHPTVITVRFYSRLRTCLSLPSILQAVSPQDGFGWWSLGGLVWLTPRHGTWDESLFSVGFFCTLHEGHFVRRRLYSVNWTSHCCTGETTGEWVHHEH